MIKNFSTDRFLKCALWLVSVMMIFGVVSASATGQHSAVSREPVDNVLFIGDSMTGWMAERLEAYGVENGFEVATVLWDGSTLPKWGANSGKIASYMAKYKPDVVFVSLGMNELLERNPETRLRSHLNAIKRAIGDTPIVWVGPPSWPGKGKGEILNNWLEDNLPEGSYFCSSELVLPRQSAKNPHPTRAGINKWMDTVMEWLSHKDLGFKSYHKPTGVQQKRGKVFIYRKMNQAL